MSSSEPSLKSRPMLGSATLTMNKSRLARQMPTQTIASTTLGEAAEGRGAAGSTTSTACTGRMESLRSILVMTYVFHTGFRDGLIHHERLRQLADRWRRVRAAVEFGQHGKLRRSQPRRHERGIIELRHAPRRLAQRRAVAAVRLDERRLVFAHGPLLISGYPNFKL